ncbi:hypothetical protein J1N35_032993 [Gossypium stocksii]|uniref:CRIB domain-containing protein n=1 Tax=Gossypium stocksii TaxID=47602 RepID=A0A9D3UPG1_9ROSI|nr:hypothetical protein J1N35_032993 [Gossypium stocksii]
MATKIKRLYKKFKNISRIFAVKEKKMEIGYPTDVKHVTHIGWDTPSHSTAPSSILNNPWDANLQEMKV